MIMRMEYSPLLLESLLKRVTWLALLVGVSPDFVSSMATHQRPWSTKVRSSFFSIFRRCEPIVGDREAWVAFLCKAWRHSFPLVGRIKSDCEFLAEFLRRMIDPATINLPSGLYTARWHVVSWVLMMKPSTCCTHIMYATVALFSFEFAFVLWWTRYTIPNWPIKAWYGRSSTVLPHAIMCRRTRRSFEGKILNSD